MITGRNILAIASNWHFDPTSKHHVMRILSRHNHVLWINYHGSRRPSISSGDARAVIAKLREVVAGPRRVSDTMLVLTPLLVPCPGAPWAERLNRQLVVRQIRRALRQLPVQPTQFWSFAPDVDYLIGQFEEELDLYYCVDEFSEFKGYNAASIRRRERRLIERSDVVITTSAELQRSKAALHPNTHLVPHGVDVSHFARAADAQTSIPPKMEEIAGPVFGFVGLIQDWVDMSWIRALARRRPEWSFVLVGEAQTDVAACREHANVHFLGRVPYDTLPGYCKAFDVGLIPFKVNRLTRHVNPIKLREYLAAGLPVVATDLPEVRCYRPHVLIGNTLDAFEQACSTALQQRTPLHRARRQQAVARESWETRVNELGAIVGQVLAATGGVSDDSRR